MVPNATLSICFFVDALPWQFGPYQQQGGLLALGLIARGHTVSWVATRGWSEPLEDGEARVLPSPAEAAKEIQTSPPTDAAEASRFASVRFIGGGRRNLQPGGGGRLLASNVNRVVERFGCGAAVAIMDVGKIDDNEPLFHRTALWYPNHNSAPLPRMVLGALGHLSDVVSLAPSDARMLQAELAANPKPDLPSSKVTYIPHIVQLPSWMDAERESGGGSVGGGGDGGRSRDGGGAATDAFRPFKAATRAAWRARYGVPADAFVVIVNCGNYESYNRKSLDVSLQVLLPTAPSSCLSPVGASTPRFRWLVSLSVLMPLDPWCRGRRSRRCTRTNRAASCISRRSRLSRCRGAIVRVS